MQRSLIFALLLVLIIVVFALQNSDPITINLFFWRIESSAALIISSVLFIGAILGVLFSLPSIFKKRDKDLHIIDLGEASCIALSKLINEKNIENVLAIDERTTRVLIEKPENLQKIFFQMTFCWLDDQITSIGQSPKQKNCFRTCMCHSICKFQPQ